MAAEYITKRLDGVLFSFYTAEEIRKLSVVEVSNPAAFDNLNKPLKKGLYDPSMGISPYDKNSRCITCGLEGLSCPGHIGHIELSVPVYNPLTTKYMMRVLKSLCFKCHKLRIPAKRMQEFSNMLLLIKLGYVTEKFIYDDACTGKPIKPTKSKAKGGESRELESSKSSAAASTSASGNVSKATSRKHSEVDDNVMDDFRRPNDQIRETIEKLLDIKNNPNFRISNVNTAMVKATRDTIQEIWSSVMSLKCPHCSAKPPTVKLDSNTKVLLETREEKEQIAKVLHTEKGYKKDFEIEDGDEEDKKNTEIEKTHGIKIKEAKQVFLTPLQVKTHLENLWKNNKKLLSLIFGNLIISQKTLENFKKGYLIKANTYDAFFIEALPVPPNRFRPENKMADQTYLHEHTVMLKEVLETNLQIKKLTIENKEKPKKREQKQEGDERTELTDTIRLWITLQDNVNCFIDSSKALKLKEKENSGIRQLLERKEGLFRMKMMGKRVNYSARSVISPDPYINTNEVGVPMYVAKTLTFPESVNEYNVEKLRRLVSNGAYKWPGANFIEENGVKIALDTRNETQRKALAKMLMHNYRNKVVYRHLTSGDVLLFNRQPTLHKASIMSHIARVLPKENTIRNHYANCKTYNADFDGDEMNLHLLQNHLARAEAYTISNTANQYISSTTGKPLRGLIQDSVISAFFLTNRGTFLTKDEYQQLVYMATWNVIAQSAHAKIIILKPAILKPKPMWTGKQVISSIIKTIVGSHNEALLEENLGLNMTSKAKVKLGDLSKKKIKIEDRHSKTIVEKEVFDYAAAQESDLIIRDNELLQGIVDSNQIGSAEFGIVHSFYELYGGQMTETLITCIARVMTCYLQLHGFTCSMDDLVMTEKFNLERRNLFENALRAGVGAAAKFAGLPDAIIPEEMDLNNRPFFELDSKGKYNSKVTQREADLNYISPNNEIVQGLRKKLILEKNGYKDFDNAMKPVMGKHTSGITSTLIPAGLTKSFPSNYFSAIILTGAKGSNVNQNQVSALLGQQELEGRRVPVLPSGKTLPSFIPYDPNPRSWGYITDRFLTGVRCQDFYFHCMAGREGLIDTAVKTSVSGYLQRCLIKNMETLVVQYDFTVRDGDGSVVQFYYGEDALDPTKTRYLTNFKFIENNFEGYVHKYDPASLAEKLESDGVKDFIKKRNKNPSEIKNDTIMNHFLPGSYLNATSESVTEKLAAYNLESSKIKKNQFRSVVGVKYFKSLIHPGECVGVLAGQAVGEPSTQMTLNTFHLAGHSGANVTLGIPRLREILFRGAGRVKTPMMTLTLLPEDGKDLTKVEAEKLSRKLQRLKMIELVQGIKVSEVKYLVEEGKVLPENERGRLYKIDIKFEDIEAIEASFDLDFETIKNKVKNNLMFSLLNKVSKELKKSRHSGSEIIAQKITTNEESKRNAGNQEEKEAESEEEEENEEEQKNKKKKGGKAGKKDKEKDEEKEKDLNYGQYFKKLSYEKEGNHHIVNIIIKVPLDSKKLLMLNIVESAIGEVYLSAIPGIYNCFLTTDTKEINGVKKDVFKIITEGLNFPAMFNYDFIHKNSMECNDVSELITIYGVEAARRGIINEIVRVFKPYGINVDFRHLSLIADVMTFDGRIRTLTSRGVIRDSISPFQKMSFEMASRFLTESAMASEFDSSKSASSQIVLGRPPTLGSGMFEIHHKLQEENSDDEA